MSTEEFLQLWHANLNSIIGVLVVVVFVLIGLYLFLEFLKEKNRVTGKASPEDFQQIESSLKKLLENANLTAPVKAGSSSGEPHPDVEKLRKLLAEKDEVIAKLQAQGAGAAGAGTAGEAALAKELQDKVGDLEARLAEYEIIEDDIADLSMYKEENARLKDEIETLKSGGAVSAPAPAAPVPKAAPVPPPPPAPPKEPVKATPPPPPPPPAAPPAKPAEEPPKRETQVDEVLADDIMAEFAAAVKEQKAADKVKPVEKAQLSETLAPPNAAADPAGGQGPIDTDKMLGEIADLNASAVEDDGSSGLEEGVDTDKMLSETQDLNASVNEKELADQFDDFVKEPR